MSGGVAAHPGQLDPDDPSDAELDSDGDEYSNRAEYQAGTALDDPDQVPAPRLLGLGFGRGGAGAADLQDLQAGEALDWAVTEWSAYANDPERGEVRPAWCDLNGDGDPELLLGFGPGSDGWLEILSASENGYETLAWLQVDWSGYTAANGETYPACGDLDDDGSDELLIGLGTGAEGWFLVMDQVLAQDPEVTWLQLDWASYNSANGALHPAVGNLDGDAADEIVLGLGAGGSGYLRIYDDAASDFAPVAWPRYQWDSYNSADGATWPAVCATELLIGAEAGSGGWLQRLDPAAGYAPVEDANGSWVQLGWPGYNDTNGRVLPVCDDIDYDGRDELGLATASGAWVELRDDAAAGFSMLEWLQFTLPGEVTYDGNTWPALQ